MCLCLGYLAGLLPCVDAQAQTIDPVHRGFVLTGQHADSYAAARSDRAVARMAADGSSDVAVFTQWFMDTPTSSNVAPDPTRTPSDVSILHAIGQARAAGLAVTLKPQIGIRTGNWIGYAHPSDLDAFWADYRTMLLHYADLAQESGATMLVVGTEMATLSSDETRWRALIAESRQHFSGRLTYAANYDEYERVPFWDALDYVGIDAYFALADTTDVAPSVEALTAAWTQQGILARIAALSDRVGKRVLFTEVGYRAAHTTALHPNLWNAVDVTDTAAQANAYEALYRAVAGKPWMAGLYWWEVNSDEWWVQDYSPLAKPAEQVMVDWNRQLSAPAVAEPPTPDPVQPPVSDPVQPPAADPVQPPAIDLGPQPRQSPPAAPIAIRPVIHLTLRARRLTGIVAPYQPICQGRVHLRLRVKHGGRWHYVRPPAPLAPGPGGQFHRVMPAGRLRVKAVFASPCANARSGWVSTHR
ncbi:MAG: hypothetical protein QOG63_2783 [Thermoleophilaceae bacterium]|nr:hypothetical protein [Thermoleophilaceae bacterium]